MRTNFIVMCAGAPMVVPANDLSIAELKEFMVSAEELDYANHIHWATQRNTSAPATLTFDALRKANIKRLPEFKDAHGVVCHTEPDGSDWSLCDWMTALAGEVGEAANIIKKMRRGDFPSNNILAHEALANELADVACYLDLLAKRAGIDLGEAVRFKFNKVSDCVGSKVKL